jgi:hypothetical protein
MASGDAERRLGPRARHWLGLAGALTAAEAWLVTRRRGRLLALDTVVRCSAGHLFTTWWIPGASVKALRLGPWRVQRCPVGGHLSVVWPVAVSRLSDDERRAAASCHDLRLP